MAHHEPANCLFCGGIFQADARNAARQKYCSKPPCRRASQAASRRAWLEKPQNQDYFRGPENVVRVQLWRAAHPGYWRRSRKESEAERETALALQDVWRHQPAVLIGFIAQFTGSTLQDDIARSTRQLLKLGHDILAGRTGNDPQTSALSATDPNDPPAIQLDRPPPGPRTLSRSL